MAPRLAISWLGGAALVLACAPHREAHWSPGPAPAPPPAAPAAAPRAATTKAEAGHFVLVHAAADLYTAPQADAARLNPYAFPERGRSGRFAQVFRLLGEQNGWLELETSPEPTWEAHCHGALGETEGLALRLFARVEDRVAVSAREVKMSYRDGTAITLAAGVALWPKDKPGFYQVSEGGLTFSVNPPKDAVGTSYDPSAKYVAPKEATRHIPRNALETLRYGETANVVPDGAFSRMLFVTDERPVPGGTRVTLPIGCAKLELLAPSGAVEESGGGLGLFGSGSGAAGPSPRVGAPLFWPSGAPAGTVVGQFSFERELEPQSGRRCFERALRYIDPKTPPQSVDPRNFLRLCLAAGDIGEAPPAKTP